MLAVSSSISIRQNQIDTVLVDAATNETGTFTDRTVTNNTVPPNSDATGVPAITAANAFRVPGVLTANKGTITDSNGLPEESTFTWQWVQVDGMTETNITGATSQTYTLAAADVGKTIKVKASFTDNNSYSEGPLTSVVTSTILAAATCNAPTYTGGATQIWTGKVGVEPSPAGDLEVWPESHWPGFALLQVDVLQSYTA